MITYLHIPFCRQKCPYCKFALTPVFDEIKKRRYLEYLKKEIREYFSKDPTLQDSKNPVTLYFGGGTPSVLSLDEVGEILECFPFYSEPNLINEITFECNPEDITREYVAGLFLLGINRISVGIQSLNHKTLKSIHRSDRETIFDALKSIQSALVSFSDESSNGIQPQPSIPAKRPISINIDLILGLPYSKPGETLANIRELHEQFRCITHTSVYMLEDELYPKEWKKNSLTEGQIEDEFLQILEYFAEKEWSHYELSNFAQPGYECAHNQAYWDHSEYRGFGLSASSFVGGERFANADSFSSYYRGEIDYREILTEYDIEIEKMMFGLRRDGYRFRDDLYNRQKLTELIEKGLIERVGEKIHATKTGIFLLDYIMSELLEYGPT